MQNIFRLICLSTALLTYSPLVATVIVQKNGDVISGRILEEKADKYVFQSPYGKLQIAKNAVSKLILDEKTIELKEVEFKNKKVKARLVSEENNTAVYLTEDGQTIRKEQPVAEIKPAQPVTEPEKEDIRHRFLISATGSYGLSSFQQPETDPIATGTMPPLNQSFHPNTLGFQAAAYYAWFRYAGIGFATAFYRWSGSVVFTPQGQLIAYDATTTNTSMVVAPAIVLSAFGNLGSQVRAHDLRAEVMFGPGRHSANMDLTFRNPPQNFPQTANAAGSSKAAALQAQIYYTYNISNSFRLKLGLSYYRALFTRIYEGGLQGSSPVPNGDKFFPDFSNALGQSGDNPQIISLLIGAEFGF